MVTPTTKPARQGAAAKATAKIETLRRRKHEAEEKTRALVAKAEDLEEEAAAAEEIARKASNAAAKARKVADSAGNEMERVAAELAELE